MLILVSQIIVMYKYETVLNVVWWLLSSLVMTREFFHYPQSTSYRNKYIWGIIQNSTCLNIEKTEYITEQNLFY